MNSEKKDCYLDLKSLAVRCCLSVRTLRYLLKDDENPIPFHRVGGKILVYWPDFHRWMSNYREAKVNPETEKIADEILKDFR